MIVTLLVLPYFFYQFKDYQKVGRPGIVAFQVGQYIKNKHITLLYLGLSILALLLLLACGVMV